MRSQSCVHERTSSLRSASKPLPETSRACACDLLSKKSSREPPDMCSLMRHRLPSPLKHAPRKRARLLQRQDDGLGVSSREREGAHAKRGP
jgi:hypothetical protein